MCLGSGSSPRMRGTRRSDRYTIDMSRIIPADAGNTLCRYAHPDRYEDHPRGCGEHRPATGRICHIGWDHPRGCGEHLSTTAKAARQSGSSPRMRGTQCQVCTAQSQERIIPADAGNTAVILRFCCLSKDHPRGCGEHHPLGLRQIGLRGSSPRMRGTHPVSGYAEYCDGIIPADAGNTGPGW